MTDLLYKPPTYLDLMEDRVYRAYARRRPRMPENVSHGMPWFVIARRHADASQRTWALKNVPSYEAGYRLAFKVIQRDDIEDVSIVSKRTLFRPPRGFVWNPDEYTWCGRCRRPSVFFIQWRHPALNGATVLSDEDPERCYYCGARQVFAGRMGPRRAL